MEKLRRKIPPENVFYLSVKNRTEEIAPLCNRRFDACKRIWLRGFLEKALFLESARGFAHSRLQHGFFLQKMHRKNISKSLHPKYTTKETLKSASGIKRRLCSTIKPCIHNPISFRNSIFYQSTILFRFKRFSFKMMQESEPCLGQSW